jgi:four helix bundle protein
MRDEREELRQRTRAFTLAIIRFCGSLPKKSVEGRELGWQLLHSGTFVGEYYDKAQHAGSAREFTLKLEFALEELQAARYWLDLLAEARVVPANRLQPLLSEADELAAALEAARTVRRRGRR